MTETLEHLREALAEEFEVDINDIEPEARFVDVLSLDSLDMVDIVVLIESVTGVKLNKSDLKGVVTFGDIFKLIESRIG